MGARSPCAGQQVGPTLRTACSECSRHPHPAPIQFTLHPDSSCPSPPRSSPSLSGARCRGAGTPPAPAHPPTGGARHIGRLAAADVQQMNGATNPQKQGMGGNSALMTACSPGHQHAGTTLVQHTSRAVLQCTHPQTHPPGSAARRKPSTPPRSVLTSAGEAPSGKMTGTPAGSASGGRSQPCASASSCRCGSCRRGTEMSTQPWLSAMPLTAANTWPRKEAPPLSLLPERGAAAVG